MGNNDKRPKIRFKGFNDDWEQHKLGDIAEFYNGDRSSRYPNDSDIVSDGIPFINAGDLVSGHVKLDTANKITEKKYNELSGAKIQLGDIIYCLRGTLGKNAFVDNFDIGTVASSLVDIRPKEIVGKFLFQVLNSDIEFRQRILNDEGAAQPNLSAKNLSMFEIPNPSRAEQIKVAEYFENLDNIISLHQRKLEKLGNIKKSMLEKMFPKDENKVPEIRFKGFNDDWEQHKLENVFKEYSEKNHEELPALTIIQGEGTIERDKSDRNLSYDKSNLSNYKLVNRGDFIVHLRSFEGGLEIAKNTGIISPAYHTFHGENTDSVFYYSYFRSKKFIDIDLKPHVYGIRDGRSIDIEGMKTIKIPYTKYDEQKKIGKYISTLNTLISLHQRKLEKLKNIKKACLEKMFV